MQIEGRRQWRWSIWRSSEEEDLGVEVGGLGVGKSTGDFFVVDEALTRCEEHG